MSLSGKHELREKRMDIYMFVNLEKPVKSSCTTNRGFI